MSIIDTLSSDIETKPTGFKESVKNLGTSIKEGTFDVVANYLGDSVQPLAKGGKSLNNLFDRDEYKENGLKNIPKNILSVVSETATSVKNIINGIPLAVGKVYTKGVQGGMKTLTNATTEHIWGIRQLGHFLNGALMVPATIPNTLNGLSRGLHIPFDKMNNQTTSGKGSDFKLSA